MKNRLRIDLTPESGARFLGLMLVAWQPFVSSARLPSLLLLLPGIWMILRRRIGFGTQAVRRLGILFLLLWVPILISIPGSVERPGSIKVAVVVPLFFIAGLALLKGFSREVDRKWLQRWLLIVLLAWMVDGYIQFIFGRDLLFIPLNPEGRVTGPFAGKLHLGLFLALLLPPILWRWTMERPLAALLTLVLSGFIVGISGARSSLLFYLMGVGILFFRFAWRYRLLAGVGMALALVATISFSPVISERLGRFASLASGNEKASLYDRIDLISSYRLTAWNTAWEMIKDRPFSGVGANAFSEAYATYAPNPNDVYLREGISQAHQMYVAVAAETGLTGLVCLIALVALCVAWVVRAPPDHRSQALPFAVPLAIVAFPLQSQPVLYTVYWFPVLLLLLAAMLAALFDVDLQTEGVSGRA